MNDFEYHNLDEPARKSNTMLRVGIILIIISVVLGVPAVLAGGWTVWSAMNQEMLARELVPGTLDFTVEEAGDYAVFYEDRSLINGQVISTSMLPPAFDLVLYDDQGQELSSAVQPASADFHYDLIDYSGRWIYTLEITQPGDYQLQADTAEDDDFVLAIGEIKVAQLIGGSAAVCSVCLFGPMLIVGVVLLVIGLIRH